MGSAELIPDLDTTERRLTAIKSEIDQFDQTFKRIRSGFGNEQHLNEHYHNLILSTKDISSHLSTIKKAIDAGAQSPDLRARARNLNTQAISQLRRLQRLGIEVQQYIKSQSTQSGFNDQYSNANANVDIEKASPFQQVQLQKPSAQLDLDEQRAQDMEQLESDITQLNEIFTIVAAYVHDQGDMVDSIGQNIEVAYEKVNSGNQELTNASKHRSSVRRKKCICIGITVSIVVIIIVILILSLKN